MDDPRGQLFREYCRVLEEFNPTLFLFENVKGILSMEKGELFKTILSNFRSLGYKVQYQTLNAADYGAPQMRERVIVVGTKLNNDFEYPQKTHTDTSSASLLEQCLKP